MKGAFATGAKGQLRSLKIESGLKIIPNGACQEAKLLKNVTIPDTVTKIEGSAFADCTSLKSIYIPASVTKITRTCFLYGYASGVTIRGKKGSYVQKFTKQNKLKFKAV